MPNLWNLLANQTQIGQSRSSVLTPLQWTLAMVILALGVLTRSHAPDWMIAGAGVCLFLNFAALLVAYGFFARKSPDALRSEWYLLKKLELGRVGDNLQGPRTIDAPTNPLIATSGADQKVEEEQQGS